MTAVKVFIDKLKNEPESISFSDTMALVEENFDYTRARFTNGSGEACVINDAGSNEGSCKIFALGKLLQLEEAQTLHCFGDYYRVDVLQNPEGSDHANIRNFMRDGWSGISFDSESLKSKSK